MLDHIVEKAREHEVFSREDAPTEERVWAVFLYHAGLSFRRVGAALGYSHEAVHQWYHQVGELFEPEPVRRHAVAVDETKVHVAGREMYVWAAVDVQTFEVVHIKVSPGRSDLDALLFLQTVLERCRGRPTIIVDRGKWYNWTLDDLELPCEVRRESFGERSLVESWFGRFKFRTMLFYHHFPNNSTYHSADRWAKTFAAMHNALR